MTHVQTWASYSAVHQFGSLSQKLLKLENVAIAMHYNLRQPNATPWLYALNMMLMPSLKSFNLFMPSYSAFTADTLH